MNHQRPQANRRQPLERDAAKPPPHPGSRQPRPRQQPRQPPTPDAPHAPTNPPSPAAWPPNHGRPPPPSSHRQTPRSRTRVLPRAREPPSRDQPNRPPNHPVRYAPRPAPAWSPTTPTKPRRPPNPTTPSNHPTPSYPPTPPAPPPPQTPHPAPPPTHPPDPHGWRIRETRSPSPRDGRTRSTAPNSGAVWWCPRRSRRQSYGSNRRHSSVKDPLTGIRACGRAPCKSLPVCLLANTPSSAFAAFSLFAFRGVAADLSPSGKPQLVGG